ncbi:hypothetical protein TNIN_34841 [Trichonephila inaurata madagascariensis]|uniref:Uncharacterized protein n=1 Tax=Trichonephila inaurata madagascariensis TaxID=2747483 RepID=A0A8X6YBA6_9ARAC|nr:hypothetical protein TNIN_34841 [Trichonephila inaurata madagascariensis]
MAQKRKLDYYDDDCDFDTESLSSFESDEDFVNRISSFEDDLSYEEDFRVFDSGVKLIQVHTLLADLVLLMMWA